MFKDKLGQEVSMVCISDKKTKEHGNAFIQKEHDIYVESEIDISHILCCPTSCLFEILEICSGGQRCC